MRQRLSKILFRLHLLALSERVDRETYRRLYNDRIRQIFGSTRIPVYDEVTHQVLFHINGGK